MKVNELAKAISVTPHLVRYYSRLGLLRPARNSANGYRQYAEGDLYRLQFILRAKSVGFTLSDVKLILHDADARRSPCKRVREIVRKRALDNARRLSEATVLHERIAAAIALWDRVPDREPDHESLCVLIDAIALKEDGVLGPGRRRSAAHKRWVTKRRGIFY